MFPAEELAKQFAEAGITTKNDVLPDHPTEDDFRTLLEKRSADAANDPVSSNRLLSILDMLWMTHLENLEALSESVGLRAYGQHDPLVEYRGEAHRLYRDFWVNYNGWIFTNLFRLVSSNVKVQSSNGALRSTPQQNPSGKSLVASGSKVGLPAIAPQGAKVGRNDPCPCGAKNPDGSPKKYKNCHGK